MQSTEHSKETEESTKYWQHFYSKKSKDRLRILNLFSPFKDGCTRLGPDLEQIQRFESFWVVQITWTPDGLLEIADSAYEPPITSVSVPSQVRSNDGGFYLRCVPGHGKEALREAFEDALEVYKADDKKSIGAVIGKSFSVADAADLLNKKYVQKLTNRKIAKNLNPNMTSSELNNVENKIASKIVSLESLVDPKQTIFKNLL